MLIIIGDTLHYWASHLETPTLSVALDPDRMFSWCGAGAAVVIERAGELVFYNERAEIAQRHVIGELGSFTMAACDARGETIIAANEDAAYILRDDEWSQLEQPDWFEGVGSVACSPTGAIVGYTYFTSQPWSEWGSYGDRLYGFAIFSAACEPLFEFYEPREYDEYPDLRLSLTDEASPFYLAYHDGSSIEVEAHALPHPTERDRWRSESSVGAVFAEPAHSFGMYGAEADTPATPLLTTLGADGRLLGIVGDNSAYIHDSRGQRWVELTDILTLSLAIPGVITYVDRELILWHVTQPLAEFDNDVNAGFDPEEFFVNTIDI